MHHDLPTPHREAQQNFEFLNSAPAHDDAPSGSTLLCPLWLPGRAANTASTSTGDRAGVPRGTVECHEQSNLDVPKQGRVQPRVSPSGNPAPRPADGRGRRVLTCEHVKKIYQQKLANKGLSGFERVSSLALAKQFNVCSKTVRLPLLPA